MTASTSSCYTGVSYGRYRWWMKPLGDGRLDYFYTYRNLAHLGYTATNWPYSPLWVWEVP